MVTPLWAFQLHSQIGRHRPVRGNGDRFRFISYSRMPRGQLIIARRHVLEFEITVCIRDRKIWVIEDLHVRAHVGMQITWYRNWVAKRRRLYYIIRDNYESVAYLLWRILN